MAAKNGGAANMLRRKQVGLAGNGGQFAEGIKSAPAIALSFDEMEQARAAAELWADDDASTWGSDAEDQEWGSGSGSYLDDRTGGFDAYDPFEDSEASDLGPVLGSTDAADDWLAGIDSLNGNESQTDDSPGDGPLIGGSYDLDGSIVPNGAIDGGPVLGWGEEERRIDAGRPDGYSDVRQLLRQAQHAAEVWHAKMNLPQNSSMTVDDLASDTVIGALKVMRNGKTIHYDAAYIHTIARNIAIGASTTVRAENRKGLKILRDEIGKARVREGGRELTETEIATLAEAIRDNWEHYGGNPKRKPYVGFERYLQPGGRREVAIDEAVEAVQGDSGFDETGRAAMPDTLSNAPAGSYTDAILTAVESAELGKDAPFKVDRRLAKKWAWNGLAEQVGLPLVDQSLSSNKAIAHRKTVGDDVEGAARDLIEGRMTARSESFIAPWADADPYEQERVAQTFIDMAPERRAEMWQSAVNLATTERAGAKPLAITPDLAVGRALGEFTRRARSLPPAEPPLASTW